MYSESHKIFLQTIMHEGILHDQDGKELVITLFGNEQMKNVIYEINTNLEPLSMMIKAVTCEITGETYWGITSTILQDVSSYQTQFPRTHLELFRKILSEIISARNGCVSSTVCLNLCSSVDVKLLKIDATKFLDYMVDKKWLFLKGQRCTNCETKMHKPCLERYAEVMDSLQCVSCKNDIELDLIED
ncbi:uncharacterized protein LOC122524413 isoform X2 [Polistes fuscatus]|uniref:uncharacterized protein LOC122524413 isoform X2 n=1 Tax=Polistes fuscatus TaxID=30207 RepID=UPI001CA9A68A|nr:uncharacterized protein LOC122524413 isoform X2 [Polistes fuscatus]